MQTSSIIIYLTKNTVKRASIVLRKIIGLINPFGQTPFMGSRKYWEVRYQGGGTSGSGSSGKLAIFKAEIINEFVRKHDIQSVIELGCGDGNQLKLAIYPYYVGIDVSNEAIQLCLKKFEGDTSKIFLHYDELNIRTNMAQELALSLDVIYHLVEDEVFEDYMHKLFGVAERFVIIYSSNQNGRQIGHEKTRNFSEWVARYIKGWELIEIIDNRYPYDVNDPENTSMSSFFIYRNKRSPVK